jgi:hypothetical protein
MGSHVEINYCDLSCKYASFPDKLCDGSMTCRTFVGIFCKKDKKIVYKNAKCSKFKPRSLKIER